MIRASHTAGYELTNAERRLVESQKQLVPYPRKPCDVIANAKNSYRKKMEVSRKTSAFWNTALYILLGTAWMEEINSGGKFTDSTR